MDMLKKIVFVIGLIALDQYTKILAVMKLANIRVINTTNPIVDLRYVENMGAAFGILENQVWFFILVTIVSIFVLFKYFNESIQNKNDFWFTYSVYVILAGAIGNLIDRIRLGYVIDFLNFKFVNFPVFNIADVYICLGFAIYLINYYRNERIKNDN
jgi:signal peptidase II